MEIRKYPGGGKSSPCVTQISTIGAAITSGEAYSKINGDGEDVEDTLQVLGEAMGGLPLELLFLDLVMEVSCSLLLLVLEPRLLLLHNGEKGVCDKKRAYSDPYLRRFDVQMLRIKEQYY